MLCILRASLIYYAQIRLYLCICISFASLKQMLKNRSCSWNRSVVRLVDPCAAKGHNFFRPVWKDSNLLESVGMAEGSGLLAHDLQFKMHACGCRLWLRGPGPHLWAMPKPLVLSLFVTYLYDVSNNRDPENGIVWLQITMSQASASWSPCEHWPQRKPTWLCGFPLLQWWATGIQPPYRSGCPRSLALHKCDPASPVLDINFEDSFRAIKSTNEIPNHPWVGPQSPAGFSKMELILNSFLHSLMEREAETPGSLVLWCPPEKWPFGGLPGWPPVNHHFK